MKILCLNLQSCRLQSWPHSFRPSMTWDAEPHMCRQLRKVPTLTLMLPKSFGRFSADKPVIKVRDSSSHLLTIL